MLAEIEDRLVKVLQEKVEEIPRENIVFNTKPAKPPAVTVSNVGFNFENLGLAENVDEGNVELEERFSSDGVQTSYKLEEKPLQGSVQVECPQGTLLTEKKDFDVNYDEGSIVFRKAPQKGKNRIFVKYLSQKRTVTLKGLKLKATYQIDVWDADRIKADSIAEKVVKAFLTAEDELATEGIELKPISGETLQDQEGTIRLKYAVERELRVKKLIPPITKIEITKKNY